MAARGGRRRTTWTHDTAPRHGGRPKVIGEVRELARTYTEQAVEALVGVMDDPKAPAAARVSAAIALLDRAHGRPTQTLEGSLGVDVGLADLIEMSMRPKVTPTNSGAPQP